MPSLRERFGAWVGGRRAVDPIMFHPSAQINYGPGIGSQPAHATLLQENLGISDMATRAIANRLGTLNPLVKTSRRDREGTLVDETLDDHVLKVLLDRPHPNFSWFQLARLTAQYIVTVGEGYWLKVGSGLGVPVELHPIPANRVRPLLAKNVVAGYRITDADGRLHDVGAADVARFFFPDPENPWSSEGYLGPNAVTVDSLKFSGQHLRRHYQHNATPKSVLETTAEAQDFGPDEKKNFLRKWVESYHNRLGSDAEAPAILPNGYKFVQMLLQSGADIVPLLEHWGDEALMNMGVPKSVLGKVVSGDRSSAEVNQWVMDRYTILPIATLLAEGMTHQLAHDFDPSLFVEFEPFVSEDKHFMLEQETADINGKVRSVNQIREDRALDPVSWGELPVGQIGQIPYEGMGGFELAEDQADALGEEEDEEQRTRSARPEPADYDTKKDFMEACIPVVMAEGKTSEQAAGQCAGMWENRSARASAFFAPQAEWLRQVQREKKYVPTLNQEMRRIFSAQERETLRRLEELEPRARVTPDEIFTAEEWAQLFERRVEPIREKAFLATATETFAGLGIEAEFVLTDAMRKVLEEQGAQLIKHANATTQKLIARQLEAAVAEGEGIDSMAKRIKHVFTTRRHHARTIARTEVLKSSQTAQIESFEQSGVVEKKQWNTSMDMAVRDSHGGPGGTIPEPIVGLREAFTLTTPKGTTEQADAPGIGLGGASLSAANSINCRCFVTPVVEG